MFVLGNAIKLFVCFYHLYFQYNRLSLQIKTLCCSFLDWMFTALGYTAFNMLFKRVVNVSVCVVFCVDKPYTSSGPFNHQFSKVLKFSQKISLGKFPATCFFFLTLSALDRENT